MNLGTQIRKYRTELSLSQDELAEKLFVSRQSISNWENDKTYPDIKSLLLLSEVFSVSLDQLVKGDVEIMQREISKQEREQFLKESWILVLFFIALLILPVPLARFCGLMGMGIYLVIFAAAICVAIRIEKRKKQLNIQTYKEISAYIEGKSLTEIEKARESGKRGYQKVFLAIVSGIVTFIVCMIMGWILK